jgi:sugar O-acyltransferase (sialic acid O-acetyltransferase NeuD family)
VEESNKINILGCVPALLNVLFELAMESKGIKSFLVLKNIPIETYDLFTPLDDWEIEFSNYFESIRDFNTNEYFALSVVGTKSKKKVYDYFKKQIKMDDQKFINLIHPTSYISKSVNLNYGLQLEPQSTIAACTSIGFGVNIKRNSNIGHHCEINDFVTINPGVTLSSFVKVNENTMIGSGVSIKDGITIGRNTIVGVGSVVVNDIPDNCIAYGNPCIIQKRIVEKENN